MYTIYWLINENRDKTYIGFSANINVRIIQHKQGQIKSTKYFGNFSYFILEEVSTLEKARKREKYWKSCAGRKKLKSLFEN